MQRAPDGKPETGPSPRGLGARADIDIPVEHGAVDPAQGGMSVSPDNPLNLPYFRRPPEHGGVGRDPVWRIAEEALPRELTYRPDPNDAARHGFIEPASP